jgi:hypothetical protein
MSAIDPYKCYWTLPVLSLLGPSPAELQTRCYCPIRDWLHIYCLLGLAGLGWDYSNPPPHMARYVPPKRLFLQEPHGVTSQKTPFFILKLLPYSAEGNYFSEMMKYHQIPILF